MEEPSLEEMQEQLRELRRLKDSSGWKVLLSFVQEQVQLRTTTVMRTPAKGMAEAMVQEFMKGETAGLELAVASVEAQIETLEARVKEELEELEEERDED